MPRPDSRRRSMNAMFAYDDAVAERYPMIRAGVVHATRLDNGPSSAELLTSTEPSNEPPPNG